MKKSSFYSIFNQMPKSQKKAYISVYILASLVPAVMLFFFIRTYGVNFPYWDHWVMSEIFLKVKTSSLSFQDIVKFHNEHRIAFPKLIAVSIVYLSQSWNTNLEIAFGFFVCLATYIVCSSLILKDYKISTHKLKNINAKEIHLVGASLGLSSFLLFSTVQHENWLWGFQIAWFFIIFLLFAAIRSLVSFFESKNWIYYGLAVGFCFIASFSSAHGLFTWIACAPLILLESTISAILTRQKILSILIWLIFSISTFFIYLIGYESITESSSIDYIFENPTGSINYFIHQIGAVFGKTSISPILGILILLIFVFFILLALNQPASIRKKYLPWLSIGFFGILFTCATTVGRGWVGIAYAFESRFTTVTLLLPISLINMWRISLEGRSLLGKSRRYLIASSFAIGLMFSSHLNSYISSFSEARDTLYFRYHGRACLEIREYLKPNLFENCILGYIFNSVENFTVFDNSLKEAGLAPHLFQVPELSLVTNSSLAKNTVGYIDDPYTENPEGIKLSPKEEIQFRGWVFHDSTNHRVPQGVVLLKVQGQDDFFAIADIKEERPDIAKLFGSKGLYSGWSVTINAQELEAANGVVSAYFYSFQEKEAFKLERDIEFAVLGHD